MLQAFLYLGFIALAVILIFLNLAMQVSVCFFFKRSGWPLTKLWRDNKDLSTQLKYSRPAQPLHHLCLFCSLTYSLFLFSHSHFFFTFLFLVAQVSFFSHFFIACFLLLSLFLVTHLLCFLFSHSPFFFTFLFLVAQVSSSSSHFFVACSLLLDLPVLLLGHFFLDPLSL